MSADDTPRLINGIYTLVDTCADCAHADHSASDPSPSRRFPCATCDELAAVGQYAPCQTVDLDELAEDLAREYAAAVIRRQDRAAELVRLARAEHRAFIAARRLAGGSTRQKHADELAAVAMLAPIDGTGPGAERLQRHARYMFGLILHNFAAYMAEDGRAGDVGPFHPSAER